MNEVNKSTFVVSNRSSSPYHNAETDLGEDGDRGDSGPVVGLGDSDGDLNVSGIFQKYSQHVCKISKNVENSARLFL